MTYSNANPLFHCCLSRCNISIVYKSLPLFTFLTWSKSPFREFFVSVSRQISRKVSGNMKQTYASSIVIQISKQGFKINEAIYPIFTFVALKEWPKQTKHNNLWLKPNAISSFICLFLNSITFFFVFFHLNFTSSYQKHCYYGSIWLYYQVIIFSGLKVNVFDL